MFELKTTALFIVTAIAEIVGCYLPYLCLKKDAHVWALAPAAASLALFAWLLTLHPMAAGSAYSAYGGGYVTVAIVWLWVVAAVRPTLWDWLVHVIHEHFYCNRRYAASTSVAVCFARPAGRLAPWPFDVLHEYASGPPGSACPSRLASWRFRPSTVLGTLSLSNGPRTVMNNVGKA